MSYLHLPVGDSLIIDICICSTVELARLPDVCYELIEKSCRRSVTKWNGHVTRGEVLCCNIYFSWVFFVLRMKLQSIFITYLHGSTSPTPPDSTQYRTK